MGPNPTRKQSPASNIADSIDYITEQFDGTGAHTGVIAEAVDKLDIPVKEG